MRCSEIEIEIELELDLILLLPFLVAVISRW